MTIDPCRGGPRQCMDDICRWSDVGWCGRHAADYDDDDPANPDYDDVTRQAAIIGYQEPSELRA